jgi:putative endonuclease
MASPYFVYILECNDTSLYTGITTDVHRRFAEHRARKGGNYTRSHRAIKLLYSEQQPNRSAALKREAFIKKLPRAKKFVLMKTARVPEKPKKGIFL